MKEISLLIPTVSASHLISGGAEVKFSLISLLSWTTIFLGLALKVGGRES
ncbi:hypothetical protein [Pyrococcus abyssi]|nr:hypothetical protein [Pyrococcus abyssi]